MQLSQKIPVARKEQVSQYFEHMKKVLQIKRVPASDLLGYVFDQSQDARAETTVENLATIIYSKFFIPKNDAFMMARYLIEKPIVGSSTIEYNPKASQMNRKLIKTILD